MANTDWRAELGAKTTEALGRFGVAGRVEVDAQFVWLFGHGPTVKVRFTEIDASTAARGAAELQTTADRLARELSGARRRASGQTGTQSNWFAWLRLVPPLAVVAIAAWLGFRYLLPASPAPQGPTRDDGGPSRESRNPASQLMAKQVRDDQNCQRTVSRIQTGGAVTPLDIDGWLVELSLLGDQVLPTAPALDEHFRARPGASERTQQSVYTPILNQTDARQSGVVIAKEPLAAVRPVPSSGIVITWRGQYVTPYFQQNDRAEYIRLAGVLFESLHATHGALYARCAQGPARYLGSWFRGPDVGGALWMLVTEMEVASGSARLKLSASDSRPEELRAALGHLADSVQPITRKGAAYALASSGGTVSERVGHHATVEFPFSPANRANPASVSIASKVWP